MDKNYVLEGALVSCEFGCRPCELKTLSHRHITEGEAMLPMKPIIRQNVSKALDNAAVVLELPVRILRQKE